MSLTDSDRDMLKYFSQEKGDPERWVQCEKLLPDIKRELPAFYELWEQKKRADAAFSHIVSLL